MTIRGSHVALCFHGHYHRTNVKHQPSWCTDFRVTLPNIRARIIDPLKHTGVLLRTYLHTYRSGCAARDASLLAGLQPVAHVILAQPPMRSVDGCIAVLRLALGDRTAQPPSDAFVLLRFDVTYTIPIDALPLRWDTVNLPSAAVPTWRACELVHDIFAVVARPHVDAFVRSLDLMGRPEGNRTAYAVVHAARWPPEKASTCGALVHGFTLRGDLGGGHFVVPPLRRFVGAANVTAFEPYVAGVAGGAFARIDRTCGPGMTAGCPHVMHALAGG